MEVSTQSLQRGGLAVLRARALWGLCLVVRLKECGAVCGRPGGGCLTSAHVPSRRLHLSCGCLAARDACQLCVREKQMQFGEQLVICAPVPCLAPWPPSSHRPPLLAKDPRATSLSSASWGSHVATAQDPAVMLGSPSYVCSFCYRTPPIWTNLTSPTSFMLRTT